MTTIKLKNGSGAPTAGDLAQGEPALDLTNKRLYTEDSGGTVIEVGTNPGTDVTFADNRKAIFGAGSDLQIYHDGTHSRVVDAGTGNLNLQGDNLRLKTADAVGTYLEANNGGAVTITYNSSPKLATTSTGIDVTGTAVTDGLTVDGTATMTVSDNSNVLTLKSTDADENSGPRFALTRDSGSPADNDYVGLISFNADDDGGNVTRFSYMVTQIMDASNGSEDGALRFFTTTAGSEVETLSLVSGQVGIGTSSPSALLEVATPSSGSAAVFNLLDNTADGFVVKQGSNEYISVDTTNTAEVITLGNTTTIADVIVPAGNVGIGTTAPSTRLSVRTGSANGIELDQDSDLATDSARLFFSSSSGGCSIFNTSGSLRFSSGATAGSSSGTERMRIDSSGSVGIGTTSPFGRLSVDVTAGAPASSGNMTNGFTVHNSNGGRAIQLGVNETGAYNYLQSSYVNNANVAVNMAFFTGASERMRIDTSGNVGIGTSSPQFDLQTVNGGLDSRGTGSGIAIRNNIYFDSSDKYLTGSGAASTQYFDGSGNIIFYNTGTASTGAGNAVSLSERVRIDSSGNFLVGTNTTSRTTAGHELHANGFARHTASNDKSLEIVRTTADGEMVEFFKDSSLVGSINSVGGSDIKVVFSSDGDQYITGNAASNYLSFSSANAERMRLTSDGRLLIGKTSADTGVDGIQTRNDGLIACTRDGDLAGIFNRKTSDGSVVEFRKNNNGVGSISVTASATAYNTSSDQRLKENIVDAPSASDDIDAIQVRSFDWKADGSHQKYGMVAQELQSVAPEAVSGDADSDEMMGVDYSKLVPMMLKEIQSLRARVAQLEGEN